MWIMNDYRWRNISQDKWKYLWGEWTVWIVE